MSDDVTSYLLRKPEVCTPDQPSGMEPFWSLPSPQSLSYQAYISPEGYEEIQGLLPYTGILNNAKLDKIVPIPSNGLNLNALGPKTDDGLLKWYVENFLPKAEGSHQYLYLDDQMKITLGTGLNFSNDRLKVYGYKDHLGKRHYSSSIPAARHNTLIAKFDPHLFLAEDPEYRNAILDKLQTVIRSFYVGKKSDLIRDRYLSNEKASRQQICQALIYLSQKIIEKKKLAAQHYVSDENSIFADQQDTDAAREDFLKTMMPNLHRLVPRFSQFPAGAQLAIIDMAFNTNYYVWKYKTYKVKGGHATAELHSFYEQINRETVDWDSVATDPKDPAGCTVDDVTDNFVKVITKKVVKTEARCSNFYFWRKKIGLTRNVATQILLILADG